MSQNCHYSHLLKNDTLLNVADERCSVSVKLSPAQQECSHCHRKHKAPLCMLVYTFPSLAMNTIGVHRWWLYYIVMCLTVGEKYLHSPETQWMYEWYWTCVIYPHRHDQEILHLITNSIMKWNNRLKLETGCDKSTRRSYSSTQISSNNIVCMRQGRADIGNIHILRAANLVHQHSPRHNGLQEWKDGYSNTLSQREVWALIMTPQSIAIARMTYGPK